MAVEITLNGETRSVDAGLNLRALLERLGLDPAKIAVERNLEIVPRSTYDQVGIANGDRLEIVHFIGGGNAPVEVLREDKPFIVAGRTFKSRLIVGTGKYKDYALNAAALEASGAEIVTVAVRRVNLTDPSQPMLVDFIDPKKVTYLPTRQAVSRARRRYAPCAWRARRAAGAW